MSKSFKKTLHVSKFTFGKFIFLFINISN
jgi:hypothetical protein